MPAPAQFPAVVVDHERHEPAALRDIASADLTGELLLEVLWSSLNYKDALASRPDGQVARSSPLVLGIDHVGVVRESGDARYAEGDVVIAHGNDLGAVHHGGLAAWSRVSADWVVPVPASLTPRQTMILGTAGYTAGASVLALERHGLTPADGPVLVTAGTGGVGSAAIAMLHAHGYTVHASTGKPDSADWLRSLGAREVVDRESVTRHAGRPLSKQLWAATVDSVGGATLAGALSATRYGGAVAASGLTGDARLETTVMPFILRHVSLLGIDSSATGASTRQAIWGRVATDLRPADLEALVRSEIGLDEVVPAFDELLAGGARGRFLVRLAGEGLGGDGRAGDALERPLERLAVRGADPLVLEQSAQEGTDACAVLGGVLIVEERGVSRLAKELELAVAERGSGGRYEREVTTIGIGSTCVHGASSRRCKGDSILMMRPGSDDSGPEKVRGVRCGARRNAGPTTSRRSQRP